MAELVRLSLLGGFQYCFLALGAMLTFRLLGFPDITVQGSFPLGAAMFAELTTAGSVGPVEATICAIAAGAIAGAMTGALHTILRIDAILSSILVATALNSIILFVMGGVPNISLINVQSIFGAVLGPRAADATGDVNLVASGVLAVAIAVMVYWFLRTDFGILVRVVGTAHEMARSSGASTGLVKILTIAIGNGLAALSGAIVGQYVGSADSGLGIGVVTAAIGSLILGEVVVGRRGILRMVIGAALVGPVLYEGVLNGALLLGYSSDMFQLITSLLIAAVVLLSRVREHIVEPLVSRVLRTRARRVPSSRAGVVSVLSRSGE